MTLEKRIDELVGYDMESAKGEALFREEALRHFREAVAEERQRCKSVIDRFCIDGYGPTTLRLALSEAIAREPR